MCSGSTLFYLNDFASAYAPPDHCFSDPVSVFFLPVRVIFPQHLLYADACFHISHMLTEYTESVLFPCGSPKTRITLFFS